MISTYVAKIMLDAIRVQEMHSIFVSKLSLRTYCF